MSKTSFAFIVLLLCCGAVAAQGDVDGTFQFVDAEGRVVPDGSVITVTEAEEDDFGGVLMPVPLSVRNVSGQRAAVSMYEAIDAKPNGQWQTCAFGSCKVLFASGYSPKSIVDEDYESGIDTEWLPDDEGYATWEVRLQIHVFDIVQRMQFGQLVEEPGTEVIGYGPTVTVRFRYDDPDGIRTVPSRLPRWGGEVYDLSGRKLAAPRGLCITGGRKVLR